MKASIYVHPMGTEEPEKLNILFCFILFCTNIVRQTDVLNKMFNDEPSLIPCFIAFASTSETLISLRFYVKIDFYKNH